MADVAGEFGTQYPVLVVEDPAAEDVEQHVGVVMRRHGFLGCQLEPVCGSDDARQFVAARVDRTRHGLRGSGGIRKLPQEIADLTLGALDIGYELPSP